jgi:hypothetical protein
VLYDGHVPCHTGEHYNAAYDFLDFPEFGGTLRADSKSLVSFIRPMKGAVDIEFPPDDIRLSPAQLEEFNVARNPAMWCHWPTAPMAALARFGDKNFATLDVTRGTVRLFWNMRLRQEWITACVFAAGNVDVARPLKQQRKTSAM